jgi:hypothetical protein
MELSCSDAAYIYTVRIADILYACPEVYACPWLGEAWRRWIRGGADRRGAAAAAAAVGHSRKNPDIDDTQKRCTFGLSSSSPDISGHEAAAAARFSVEKKWRHAEMSKRCSDQFSLRQLVRIFISSIRTRAGAAANASPAHCLLCFQRFTENSSPPDSPCTQSISLRKPVTNPRRLSAFSTPRSYKPQSRPCSGRSIPRLPDASPRA